MKNNDDVLMDWMNDDSLKLSEPVPISAESEGGFYVSSEHNSYDNFGGHISDIEWLDEYYIERTASGYVAITSDGRSFHSPRINQVAKLAQQAITESEGSARIREKIRAYFHASYFSSEPPF